MLQSVKIAPSILAADMANLQTELDRIADADFVHFDVMDGHFTSNLSFGVEILKATARVAHSPIDVHMMVTNPDETIDWYIDAGANLVTVHWEASTHLHRIIHHLQERSVKAGVALNPATPICVLESIIEDVDMVLLMSVNPGFGGQSFIPSTLSKLQALRALCKEHDVHPMVEVDGGVTAANIEEITAAGANVLVAGSAVFKAEDPALEVVHLRELGNSGLARACA